MFIVPPPAGGKVVRQYQRGTGPKGPWVLWPPAAAGCVRFAQGATALRGEGCGIAALRR